MVTNTTIDYVSASFSKSNTPKYKSIREKDSPFSVPLSLIVGAAALIYRLKMERTQQERLDEGARRSV